MTSITPTATNDAQRQGDADRAAAAAAGRACVRVVLPAYNEEEALRPLLDGLHAVLIEARLEHEIVVVDDGSADSTALIASQASFDMPLRLVSHERNQGLAAALRTGFVEAVGRCAPGDIVVTLDADNTQPPGLIPRMVGMIREGHDVVIASRYQHGSRTIGVPFSRVLMSLGARALFQLVFPIRGVRDYTCGFRAYRAEALAEALRLYGDSFVSEQGFSCMADVLLKMRRLPLVMGEAPMILRYDQKGGASKMRVARTVMQTLSLMLRRRMGR
ncbi:Undecaprenyl-phosphate 4-deoxy-4-formamido-L-arabinose transferase [Pseudobythopirellula maris]|uniref:Undecaprenyl-phosphate 4-deoxy-4-formamido-L-arabinose transferase n=1 Tax=Pseudobythopirellula maris TaxID=2527991 RepID=A0A5C5ZT74_9BACT|nr:glycosyltransferase family 2 protein [Pseudobythopirellula maris]TWT90237.1 Undecaprenyl-phosphate 4-deoxy-4-formamido-L-arabinose transferase [Pseudobythopirellula maris]